MKILVDTNVWWFWLKMKNGEEMEDEFKTFAETFEKIYSIVSSEPEKYTFLFNDLVEHELKDKYLFETPVSFSEIKKQDFMKRISIPLSRFDGTYKFNGGLKHGGRFGGTLRCMLSATGHDHEKAFKEALPEERENPAHHKARRNEWDVEHLESALEEGADLFITAEKEKKIFDRLRRTAQKYPDNQAVKMALNICVTPDEALKRLLNLDVQ